MEKKRKHLEWACKILLHLCEDDFYGEITMIIEKGDVKKILQQKKIIPQDP